MRWGGKVWVDVRRQLRANVLSTLKWVGPCKVFQVDAGPLYYVEYWTEGSLTKFNRVHPQFMRRFRGESG